MSVSSAATRIGATPILHEIDLSLPSARWTSIVGPNGAGKSTLLRAMAGLLPTAGRVLLQGRPLGEWTARARACQLAWLGQGESGGDDLTAYDVTLLGRLPHRSWLAPASSTDHAAVARALHETQVWHLRDRRLGDLSGGERQRVLLARALAVEAPVLLMDEPLAHLDPPHQSDWLAIVRRRVSAGDTVVSVLHELSVALQADDLLIVRDGRIVHHGPCADPTTHAALQAAFDNRITIHALQGGWVALPRAPREKAIHAD
nr:ABC transporter ATP-binding protein [Ottowia thiooxydans]